MYDVDTANENVENFLHHKPADDNRKSMVDSAFSLQALEINQFNISIANPDNESSYHDYGLGIVLTLSISMIVCILLALIGNFLVIMTVIRHKGMRTRTNMFIVNLAVADILVAFFNMPFSLTTVIRGRWIFGDPFCQFNGFTMPLFFIVSIQTLMYISIHKYISITKPFSPIMTNRKILLMIAVGWVWSSVCATFTLKIGNHVVYKKGSSQCGPSLPDEVNEYIHSIAITTFNYILPLVVMSYCYFHIFREIHDHMERIRQTSNIDLQNTLNQQKRITFTLFAVLACFLICWTPFIIYSCSAAFLQDKTRVPLLANPIAYWCGYLNSACNPIIYALRSPSFRQGYKEIICHYQAYNVGGSLATRPSLSPYGTIKRVSSHISHGVIKGVRLNNGKTKSASEKKLLADSLRAKGFVENRCRTNGRLELPPMLTLSLQTVSTENAHIGLNQKPSSCSLQSNMNTFDTKEKEVPPATLETPEVKPRLLGKRHSFPLTTNEQRIQAPVCEQAEEHKTPIYTDPVLVEPVHMLGSTSTISKQSYQSSNEERGSMGCPMVVVDAASSKSSTQADAEDWDRKLVHLSSAPWISQGEFCDRGPDLYNDADGGKWSPMSTKSLEMGRNHRSSSKASKGHPMNHRKAQLGKPQSPLYSASKEQLMKWMSEDCLDRSRREVFSFGLGAKFFTSFRNMRRHHKHCVSEFHDENEGIKVQKI